jgi:ubiquinone/menaquinone biosynthesis C-methylase UbiE
MMAEHLFEQDTQNYFRQVLEKQYHDVETMHPYAHNHAWQDTYTALRQWITECGLENKRVLEVGCGAGLLQDLVPDYIGVDLAPSSSQYMYKPFSVCSAHQLPFPDNHFDAVWSVWVLEHIEYPELMLDEMRRVVKPGGAIFIRAAFAVDSWISQGLHKRPFRDLMFEERISKLTIPLRASALFKIGHTLPKRLYALLRYLRHSGPTRLDYRRLTPNYETYWDYDADACVSLDAYSMALYFLSRGDQPHFSGGHFRSLIQRSQPQAYIVWK